MDPAITIILGSISIIVSLAAVYYAKRADNNFRNPKIDLELSPDHVQFMLRNVGTDTAVDIVEINNICRDLPNTLWNYNGPIDYIRIKTHVAIPLYFQDGKVPKPSSVTQFRFEYKNSDGDRFYSSIEIERAATDQQIYFTKSKLIKWGKF